MLTIEWSLIRKLKFENNFIMFQNCPFKEELCLDGYTQSSVPGEISKMPLTSIKKWAKIINQLFLVIMATYQWKRSDPQTSFMMA